MEEQMDQWDLVIKVKHGDTLGRIGAHVHVQLMDLNMSNLRSKIISLFKISRDDELILSYTDEDGDIVTLDDDDELHDAVIGQRLNPLRINVQLKSPDSSDARPERSSPSSSVKAPRPVVIPTVVEQENTILEDIELPSDMTHSVNQIPNENNRSGNMVVQGAGTMSPSVDPNVDATKKGKASLYPIVDLLASTCTANNIPEHEHEHEEDGCDTYLKVYNIPPTNQALHGSRNYWTPAQLIPNHLEGCAGTMDGGSSSKQPSMKAELSSPSQTGFNSQAITYADFVRMCLRMPPLDIIDSNSTPRGFRSGAECDRCGMQPIVGPRFKAKGEEEYDLCNFCFTQKGCNEAYYTRIDDAHPRGSRMLKGPPSDAFPPIAATAGDGNHVEQTLLKELEEMGFKQNELGKEIHRFNEYDLSGYAEWDPLLQSLRKWDSMAWSRTVLDGTVVPPSTHFTKIWRLRNIGNVPWPFGTHLLWVGGYQFGDRVSAHLEIPQIGVPVDKELDIAVDFTAPSRPGCYISYWRIAAPNGQKFGQRVWVLIQVDYSTPNSAASSSVHLDLNLNLPPESNGRDESVIIDANAVHLDSDFPETNFCGTNEGWVEPVYWLPRWLPSKSWIKPT